MSHSSRSSSSSMSDRAGHYNHDDEPNDYSEEEQDNNNAIGLIPAINLLEEESEPIESPKDSKNEMKNAPQTNPAVHSLTAVIDTWSLGAQNLYRTISKQEHPQEVLRLLIQEANSGKDVSESELFRQIIDKKSIEEGEKASSDHVDRANVQRSVSKPESYESEEDGVSTQINTIFKAINIGVSPAGNTLNSLMGAESMHSKLDSIIEWSLKKLEDQWRSVVRGFLPIQHMQTMLLVCLVQMITVNRIVNMIPIVACYVAFLGMVYNTLAMFHSRHVMKEVEVWNRLVNAFEPNAKEKHGKTSSPNDKDHQESFYNVKSMENYINFFTFLLVFVLAFAMSGNFVPNCLLLCLVACFLSALCFVALPDRLDRYAGYALILGSISSLPLLFKKFGWRMWKVLYPLASLRLGYFNLSISIPALAYIAVPTIYLIMAKRFKKWDEVMRVQVPHIVCLLWAEVAVLLFVPAPLDLSLISLGLTFGLISLIMWPTGVGLVLVIAMGIAQLRDSLSLFNIIKVVVTGALLLLPFAYKKAKRFLHKHYKEWAKELGDSEQNRRRTLVLVGFYVCLVLMSVALLFHGSQSHVSLAKDVTNLSWTAFEKKCGQSSRPVNEIERQILCSELKGTSVDWKGTVHEVRIIKIDNSLENLLEYMPAALAKVARCFYGFKENGWLLGPDVCSLSPHHWYTFELEVNGPWGENVMSTKGTITLTGGHVFLPILRHLQEGDVVRLVASFDLYPSIRWNPPRLKLLRLECKTCKVLMDKEAKTVPTHSVFSKLDSPDIIPRVVEDYSLSSNFWTRIFSAFKFLFNFFFAPFVTVR